MKSQHIKLIQTNTSYRLSGVSRQMRWRVPYNPPHSRFQRQLPLKGKPRPSTNPWVASEGRSPPIFIPKPAVYAVISVDFVKAPSLPEQRPKNRRFCSAAREILVRSCPLRRTLKYGYLCLPIHLGTGTCLIFLAARGDPIPPHKVHNRQYQQRRHAQQDHAHAA